MDQTSTTNNSRGMILSLFDNTVASLNKSQHSWFYSFLFNNYWATLLLVLFGKSIVAAMINIAPGEQEGQKQKVSRFWIFILHSCGVGPMVYLLCKCIRTGELDLHTLFYSFVWSYLVEWYESKLSHKGDELMFLYFGAANFFDLILVLHTIKYYNVTATYGIDLCYLIAARITFHLLSIINRLKWFLHLDIIANILMFKYYKQTEQTSSNYPLLLSKVMLFPRIVVMFQFLLTLLIDRNIIEWDIIDFRSVTKKVFKTITNVSLIDFIFIVCMKYFDDFYEIYEKNKLGTLKELQERFATRSDLHRAFIEGLLGETSVVNSYSGGYLNSQPLKPGWFERYGISPSSQDEDYKGGNNDSNIDSRNHKQKKSTRGTVRNVFGGTIQTYFKILELLFIHMTLLIAKFSLSRNKITPVNTKVDPETKNESSLLITKDMNKYVTRKNYSKYFRKNESCDIDKLQTLPDYDTSEDYEPSENPNDVIYDQEGWGLDEKQSNDDDDSDNEEENLHDELLQLILSSRDGDDSVLNHDTLMWKISMWSLLKYQLIEDKRLTRSEYAKLCHDELVSEILMEQRFSPCLLLESTDNNINNNTNTNTNIEKFANESDDEIDVNLICPVCHLHPRNIVLWPCGCLALCNSCRLKFGHRAISQCVSCDKTVDGYTKVNFV